MTPNTVVVLGGGVGGLVAAHRLRRRLDDRTRVVLVDRETLHHYAPSFLWTLVGARRSDRLARRLDRVRRHGIQVEQAEVTAIDLDASAVHSQRAPSPVADSPLAGPSGYLPVDPATLATGVDGGPPKLHEEFGAPFLGRISNDLHYRLVVDRERQRRAMACHASQANPVPPRRVELQGSNTSACCTGRSPWPPARTRSAGLRRSDRLNVHGSIADVTDPHTEPSVLPDRVVRR